MGGLVKMAENSDNYVNSDDATELRNDVRSLAPEVRKRLADVIERIGESRVADLLGCHVRTLHRYIDGSNKPPASVILKIADEARVSLDWLMRGIEHPPHPETPLDFELLRDCLGVIEELAPGLPPDKKAEAVTLLYELALEEPADARVVWLHTKGPKILRLAG